MCVSARPERSTLPSSAGLTALPAPLSGAKPKEEARPAAVGPPTAATAIRSMSSLDLRRTWVRDRVNLGLGCRVRVQVWGKLMLFGAHA